MIHKFNCQYKILVLVATLCFICGVHYKYLTKKFKYKHEKNSLAHQCDLCEKSFPNKADFNSHTQVHHKGKNSFNVCSKIFASRKHVKVHIKEVHEERQTFQCDYCQKQFASECNLSVHANVSCSVMFENRSYKCN